MRKKGELTGSYSLRVLVISEWDWLRAVRACGCGKRKWPGLFLRYLVGLDRATAKPRVALLLFSQKVYSGST